MNAHEFHCKVQNEYGEVGLLNKVKGGYTSTILTYMAGIGSKKKCICHLDEKGNHLVRKLEDFKKTMKGHWFIVHYNGTDMAKATLERVN